MSANQYNSYMLLKFDDLLHLRNKTKGNIVYARGAFDILHAGHIEFLEYARQQGDVLVVGIIPDKVIKQNKGKDRPVKDETDRLHVINAIKSVDYAFIVPSPTESVTSTEFVIRALKPDVFVLFDEKQGYTQHFEKLLKQYGVRLILDKSNKISSTTSLVKKLRKA